MPGAGISPDGDEEMRAGEILFVPTLLLKLYYADFPVGEQSNWCVAGQSPGELGFGLSQFKTKILRRGKAGLQGLPGSALASQNHTSVCKAAAKRSP